MRTSQILDQLTRETKCRPEDVRCAAMTAWPNITMTNAFLEADLEDDYKRDIRLELLVLRTKGEINGRKAV